MLPEERRRSHRPHRKRFMRCLFGAALLAACLDGAMHAQAAPPPRAVPTLAPVVVTGVLPGPALWKVSKGDHVMWVLGLSSPVPQNMQWKSVEVENRIAGSQAVLTLPSMQVGVRTRFYRSHMMPSMRQLAVNPGQQTLQDVLSPPLYQRWLSLKAQYLGDNRGVERMRPILAGRELYEAALKRYGLVDEYGLEDIIDKTATRDNVLRVNTSYQLGLKDPREAILSLDRTSMNDRQCLAQLMDALEHGLAQATARANAWATGDIDTLRSILSQTQEDSCLPTLDDSQFAAALGVTDIERRVRTNWIDSAKQALDKNKQTFAVLPMHELLAPDGYLSALQADGYSVQAPAQ